MGTNSTFLLLKPLLNVEPILREDRRLFVNDPDPALNLDGVPRVSRILHSRGPGDVIAAHPALTLNRKVVPVDISLRPQHLLYLIACLPLKLLVREVSLPNRLDAVTCGVLLSPNKAIAYLLLRKREGPRIEHSQIELLRQFRIFPDSSVELQR